jgi:hypothetical protein
MDERLRRSASALVSSMLVRRRALVAAVPTIRSPSESTWCWTAAAAAFKLPEQTFDPVEGGLGADRPLHATASTAVFGPIPASILSGTALRVGLRSRHLGYADVCAAGFVAPSSLPDDCLGRAIDPGRFFSDLVGLRLAALSSCLPSGSSGVASSG